MQDGFKENIDIYVIPNLSDKIQKYAQKNLLKLSDIGNFIRIINYTSKLDNQQFLNNGSELSKKISFSSVENKDDFRNLTKLSIFPMIQVTKLETKPDLNIHKIIYQNETNYKEASGYVYNNTLFLFDYFSSFLPLKKYFNYYPDFSRIRDSFISSTIHNTTNFSFSENELRHFFYNGSFPEEHFLQNFKNDTYNIDFIHSSLFFPKINKIDDGILITMDQSKVYYELKKYSLIIDTKSVFDIGPDYGIGYTWDSNSLDNENWYKAIYEIASDGNYTLISNKLDNNFLSNPKLGYIEPNNIMGGYPNYSLPFEFNISSANYPEEYNINILFEEGFTVKTDYDLIKCVRADVSQWIPIPPPDLSLTLSSNSIDLRPEETKNNILKVKNKSNLNAKILFLSNSDKVDISMNPNPIFMSPNSNATSVIKLTAPSYTTVDTFPINIKSMIEFPQNITIVGTNTTIKNVSDAKFDTINEFTVNLLPPYALHQYLSSFVNEYITPLNSIWTFFVGVAVILTPKIIKFLQHTHLTKNEFKKSSDHERRTPI